MRGMMTTKAMSLAIPTDADLVGETLSGDRDAFGRIITRYQSLICSLAYSATGSLEPERGSRAGDIRDRVEAPQPELREPTKLRAWLVRHRAESYRQNTPAGQVANRFATPSRWKRPPNLRRRNRLPPDHVMSQEEEAILWRSLKPIPETYREPLVLFYREHQSVERVARRWS